MVSLVLVAPRIDRSAIRDIKVRAGQTFDLDIPISGEPPPEIKWAFEGKPISSTDRLKIDTKEYHTKFVCKRALRSDTGKYVITASNESGTDTVDVNVTVLDRPTSPQGPLDISNIHKEGCTLAWKPPVDDGGAEVTHYVVEKQDTASGRWEPVGETADCKLAVDDLQPNHEYKFRVKAVNRHGESDPLESTKPITAKNPFGKFWTV